MISSMEYEYIEILECIKEVKFVNMLLQEISEAQKPAILHKGNQWTIFIAKNRQVGMSTDHINICHHFLSDMVKDKETYIK